MGTKISGNEKNANYWFTGKPAKFTLIYKIMRQKENRVNLKATNNTLFNSL
jgi:hypothetical protein